ncbi:MAG: sensor histidine kinase [Gemmatimonadales bacterium]|nr:MAG: sensor histidine kinase [Gemmatimonadales bacterium]
MWDFLPSSAREPASAMPTLRTRLFIALLLAAVIPSGLLLLGGTLAFREAVVTTGTAGPWGQVAESGSELLDRLDEVAAGPAVEAAAERHREQLSESVRLSRFFTMVGERILYLLPAITLAILILASAIALLVATRVSRSLSEPVRELVRWAEALGRGDTLPPSPGEGRGSGAIREYQTLRDALRRMEMSLREARNRELERERTRSWTEMARRVAHDLKNPLTPMAMAARTVAASPDERTAEAGRVLTEEIQRLDELARSFAQFGRPPDGPPSPVDLAELLVGLHRRLRLDDTGSAEGGVRLELDVDGELLVEGHPTALERAVRNLIANAIEAAQASGTEEPVEVVLTPRGDGGATLRIRDRGPGLPEGELNRIWEPDFTTKRRGTGLGLPMVRQVILAHRGQVSARNRDGGGAEFRIELPPTISPDGVSE